MNVNKIQILDGGMGRELKRIGAPFQQPEWSALALLEAPEYVTMAHNAFISSGADIITTNSYAVVPFHIGELRFTERGHELAQLAAEIARACADKAAHPVKVAGSLSPVLGSYRPDLFQLEAALRIYRVLIAAQEPFVDHWLAETQSSIAEIQAVRQALGEQSKPLWVSFTLDDEPTAGQALLRSGETVTAAVSAAIALNVSAILFNCSQPEVMSQAVRDAVAEIKRQGKAIPVGVYANAFPAQSKEAEANAELDEIRVDLNPAAYLNWAKEWVSLGATVIGGCCGITPDHIAELANALNS
ncbi:homocysteine S-methyltransferase family protein [Tolumonas lignilytica]|uniref:homocysteine S-methyltransferase family protein n=1 Tax=Tolumonas lignilytica TaxID=1283284 RepID=UPI000571AB1B|nr:homocysteine S-methyltransferase family protein [Tolumonas lignilytica]